MPPSQSYLQLYNVLIISRLVLSIICRKLYECVAYEKHVIQDDKITTERVKGFAFFKNTFYVISYFQTH